MLISFKVSNFLSFKEETEFSMVAGKERIHPHHVVKGKKNQPNLLRAALLYGANAAGKSNFVKAIEFAQQLILSRYLNSPKNLIKKKFRLSNQFINKPTSFVFQFISKERIYEYGFKLNEEIILEEWLIDLTENSKQILFNRKNENEKVIFSGSSFLRKKSDKDFLEFVQRSTIPQTLFLTHSSLNNVEWFRDAFLWFLNLLIIYPRSWYWNIEDKLKDDAKFKEFLSELLNKAGTGIHSIKIEKGDIKTEIELPLLFGEISTNDTKAKNKKEIKEGVKFSLLHEGDIEFEKEEESEGTQRLFDLSLPFYDLATSETPKVYIIDEIERSLHTNLSYMLLKNYLEQEGKGQLIATTHDTHLLDLDLLRRDEIWFAEKDEDGATQLYSLYDFNPRYDKNIEKDYLLGRYGAIPFLGNLEFKKQLAKNGRSKK